MSNDLSLARAHAFHPTKTLMVSVTLFRSNDQFDVLPSNEIDDDKVEMVAEFGPFSFGPALFLTAVPLASCGGKGSFAAAGTGRAAHADISLSCASRALAAFALRGVRKGLRKVRGKEKKERRTQRRAGKLWKRMN